MAFQPVRLPRQTISRGAYTGRKRLVKSALIVFASLHALLALFQLEPSMSPVGSQHLQVVIEQLATHLATESGNPTSS